MLKKSFLIALFLGLGVLFFALSAEAKTKPYYEGKSISYGNTVYFGSVNMGYPEIFILEKEKIKKIINSSDLKTREDSWYQHNDLLFNVENSRLFLYLSDGRYIYKYDITNFSKPKLVYQVKDASWDWFMGLDKTGDYIVSKGTQGIKFWNNRLQVVDQFNFIGYMPYNLSVSSDGEYIFYVTEDTIKIFDTEKRSVIREIGLTTSGNHNRQLYYDSDSQNIHINDDQAVKTFDLQGRMVRKYNHISEVGYDVVGLKGKNHFYFSDGLGVVKIRMSDYWIISGIQTNNVGPNGGWAMGINVAEDSQGEKVVVYNNTGIMVLDGQLNLLDSIEATEIDPGPYEELYLKLDKIRGAPGTKVALSGGGYWSQEKLKITFSESKYIGYTDENGRFVKMMVVPSKTPGWYDIRIIGEDSSLSYSKSFLIE